MNMKKIRVNFAPHAFIYPDAAPGSNLKQNVRAAVYTNWKINGQDNFDPNLVGVEAVAQNDEGKIAINPSRFISSRTIMEVWLHTTSDSGDPEAPMAVSPNNGAFLLNLTLPIVNFNIILLQSPKQGNMKLSIFNVTFINDDTFGDLKLY
jgi:hypothetical protein